MKVYLEERVEVEAHKKPPQRWCPLTSGNPAAAEDRVEGI